MKYLFLNESPGKQRLGFLAATSVALMICSAAVNAATANGTLAVAATFVSSCTISGASINFGAAIDPIAAATPINVTGATQVRCSNSTPFEVTVGAGLNSPGTNIRALTNGTSYLIYQLYSDAAHSVIVGQTGGGSWGTSILGTGTGATQSINLYGELANLADAVPGVYTDTVVLSVNF